MLELLYLDFTLPLTNPVLKFLIILLIILITPVLLNKIRVPAILGLIIAGAVIGPYGFNLLERDSGIILSGTAGLLYIMFLAGLEIDLGDFKKNGSKSLLFGAYTFSIPMLLGIFGSFYILGYSMQTSVLLASMFASHTLIAYPLVRRMGITRNIAVNISVGGTIITDTLALLVLAVIVGMNKGEVDLYFWVRLFISILIFGLIVLYIFPLLARWFFKTVTDSVSQYIFVLTLVFLAAFLSEVAGIEGIIGAFLCGLALNPLIPRSSALMNRVEFVGNAIFIPFFLIGIGMLIDYELFFSDSGSLKVGAFMIIVATLGKYLAAILAQKSLKLTSSEGLLIFGLSNAQAAATLAAVLIGYNIITGYTEAGEPLRLLSDEVLNGTILMILFTCTVASFVTEKAGRGILAEKAINPDEGDAGDKQRVLIPMKNIDNVDELIYLASLLKAGRSDKDLYGLNVIAGIGNPAEREEAEKIIEHARHAASASDYVLNGIIRYDLNLQNAITGVVKENEIGDLILGMHKNSDPSKVSLGYLTESLLFNCEVNIYIFRAFVPLNTVKRHVVLIPPNAEMEPGFYSLLDRLWNLGRNSGLLLQIYATPEVLKILDRLNLKDPLNLETSVLEETFHMDWFTENLQPYDNIIFLMFRRGDRAFQSYMENLPAILNSLGVENSFLLCYSNVGNRKSETTNLINASLDEPVEQLEGIFRKLINRKV
ncbi:cation:proton antiporter [Christiangramia sabulilitoris]|uniref:Cation:proton antiporter n=2 Tax=Christiangramia sabulilitoris TaxID=2583991 RepID=A0A550I0M2_9FLAO|nr:cation:proton antiporter [Christiangramia sabulilitoris]